MNVGKTLFAQVMEFVPWTSFTRIVERYSGNAWVGRMTCAEQFRVMAFAQWCDLRSGDRFQRLLRLQGLSRAFASYPFKKFLGTSENAVKTQI